MCSLCWLPVAKNHNFGQILTFLWALVPTPFYQAGPNVVCYSRPMVYAYVPNFVLIGLFCHPLLAKKTHFPVFWTSAFSVVANWQQPDKVEHGCTTTNLPLSNGIKIVSVLQRVHGEIGRTISDVQKRDGQTNKQTTRNRKHRRAAAKPAACANPLMLSTPGSKGKRSGRVR